MLPIISGHGQIDGDGKPRVCLTHCMDGIGMLAQFSVHYTPDQAREIAEKLIDAADSADAALARAQEAV